MWGTRFWSSNNVCASLYGVLRIICSDPDTQWMVLTCAFIYFIILILFQWRQPVSTISTRGTWLTGIMMLAVVEYAFAYASSAVSTLALNFICGALFGQCAAARICLKIENRGLLAFILLVSLSFLSIWQIDDGYFGYHDQTRWTGLWDNPNIFGLLMGAGSVFAIGGIVSDLKFFTVGRAKPGDMKLCIRKFVVGCFCFLSTLLLVRGLFHSFSRGAWVATVFGLGYLFYQSVKGPNGRRSLRCLKMNFQPTSVILISAVTLVFWHFSKTTWHPARRAFSSVNTVDFSWRNRVAAWEGAMQITAEHSWFGVGWNQPETLYDHYYLRPKLDQSAAIEMNDYLMFVATLGIPALFCFGMYLWLSLFRKAEAGNQEAELNELDWLRTTCRAGAIVLAVGFWFDGGLFKLATASTFWILLELGSGNARLPSEYARA